jgi:hypothetical protein
LGEHQPQLGAHTTDLNQKVLEFLIEPSDLARSKFPYSLVWFVKRSNPV